MSTFYVQSQSSINPLNHIWQERAFLDLKVEEQLKQWKLSNVNHVKEGRSDRESTDYQMIFLIFSPIVPM